MTSPEERIAVLETKVDLLTDTVKEMAKDVRVTNETLSQAKGGWRLFMMVGGFSAAVGAFIGKFLPYFWKA